MTTVDTSRREVHMIVDIATAMPVGGPYMDLDHSRDAWGWLVTPGANLSHLRLVVRDREDLVAQVLAWRETFLRERHEQTLQRAQERQLAGSAHGCC